MRFEGWQVIDGLRLERLRATALGGLPFFAAMYQAQFADRLAALNIWVDSRGIVRRMDVRLRAKVTVQKVKLPHHEGYVLISEQHAGNVRHGGYLQRSQFTWTDIAAIRRLRPRAKRDLLRFITRAEESDTAIKRAETAVTTLRLTFTAIGKPQHISVPANAIPIPTRG